jgi:hypothetical protein
MILTKIQSKTQVKTRQSAHFNNLLLIIKEFELGLNLGKKPSLNKAKLINKQVFEIVKGISNI